MLQSVAAAVGDAEVSVQIVDEMEEEHERRRFYCKILIDKQIMLDKRANSCFEYYKEKALKDLEASKKQHNELCLKGFKISIATITVGALMIMLSNRVRSVKVLLLCLSIALGSTAYNMYFIKDLIISTMAKPEFILPDWLISYMTDHVGLARSFSEEYLNKVTDENIDVNSTGRRWSSPFPQAFHYERFL